MVRGAVSPSSLKRASRSASTSLICSSSNSSRSSPRVSCVLRWAGSGCPSPVRSLSRHARRSRRIGSYSLTPTLKRSPLMRLTCMMRSSISALRSRPIRRQSSFSTVGMRTIEQTLGSPRIHAIKVRTSASPSILSVFARRCLRETAIDAASTTWLAIQSCASRARWIQNRRAQLPVSR